MKPRFLHIRWLRCPFFCHTIFDVGSEVREVLNQVHGILEDEIHEIAGVCLYSNLYMFIPYPYDESCNIYTSLKM